MPKALCMTGMVISILVFLLFSLDLLFSLIGLDGLAPFDGASMLMDIVLVICAASLTFLSWKTWKEQV